MPIEGKLEDNPEKDQEGNPEIEDLGGPEIGGGGAINAPKRLKIKLKLRPDRYSEGKDVSVELYNDDPGRLIEDLTTDGADGKKPDILGVYDLTQVEDLNQVTLPCSEMEILMNRNVGWGNLIGIVQQNDEGIRLTIMELHRDMIKSKSENS